ncbi:tetratricopeptide repeat protein [Peredibacter starrii]|uniref:Tetratricopeptide repeat protein n=1 Tax=Peredibacter starrii TaxID=28202 RepID=A0AAX4HQW6_9BACT|nr:tetratricopeptide repeat protein [Peredibacter starrii]WPU65743.1 tetratricopeptide repeat protein [Peredibacter starrii]
MKLILLPLLLIAACSTTKEKAPTSAPANVSNEAFKKEKPLSNSEISDYYQGNAKSLNPALLDETLDRMTPEELAKLNVAADPLMDISVRCGQRDFEGAFAIAGKNFNKYQKVAQYWNLVANCHLNQGSHRKALLFYNKALEVTPNYVPALNNIGVLYSRQGLDQKALVAFERANKQSKFSKTPRYNLAKLYLTYGLAEQAQPLFLSLLNGSPKDVDILNAVGSTYFLMSDYNRALSYYQQIPRSEWDRAEIGLNVAYTYKKVGKAAEAQKIFSGIKDPSSANLRRYYSAIESQLGE